VAILRRFLRTTGVLCLLVGGLTVPSVAAQNTANGPPLKEVSPGRYCSLVGIVIGTGVLNGSLLLKRDDNCRMQTIPFPASTRFVTRSFPGEWQAIDPHTIHIGDRLCVQFEANQATPATAILVLSRTDVQRQQLQMLATLHRASAFGTITKVDAATHSFEMNRVNADGSVRPLRVDAGEPMIIRRYSEDAITHSDAQAASWEELSVGSHVYIRGQRSAGGTSMRAGLIVLGGFRTLVGRVQSIDALTAALAELRRLT
jgi:hypothetical protein